MLRRNLFIAAALTATTLIPVAALAEYPERDIRVIVPWGAGGGTDGIVRKITNMAENEHRRRVHVRGKRRRRRESPPASARS